MDIQELLNNVDVDGLDLNALNKLQKEIANATKAKVHAVMADLQAEYEVGHEHTEELGAYLAAQAVADLLWKARPITGKGVRANSLTLAIVSLSDVDDPEAEGKECQFKAIFTDRPDKRRGATTDNIV